MKRLWFAVIFLAIATALCVGEQSYLRAFHAATDKQISAAVTAAENNDIAALSAALNTLKSDWSKNNNLVCTLTNHAVPNELGARIRGIRIECDDLLFELENIRAFNDILYENQRITLANIF